MSKSYKDKQKYLDKLNKEIEIKPLKFKKKKRFDHTKLTKLDPTEAQDFIDQEEFE